MNMDAILTHRYDLDWLPFATWMVIFLALLWAYCVVEWIVKSRQRRKQSVYLGYARGRRRPFG